ncbi:L-type lectin-domain containing receptor kinase S.6-like [Mangifera indica]|uniref:L-type lectin-domain containing receptor kinase S.6-like n=1 Tax=Mangifera indica TaxID=29780 RepID=UPI001CFB85B8|nr:L-type lectin-domain containing receptor kinase S.6-like [Mangifera indica]
MHTSLLFLFWATFFIKIFTFTSLPANNITLYGDAYFRDNAISLTQELTCLSSSSSSSSSPSSSPSSSSSGIGRALYLYPIRFLDSTTNTTASFSCKFSFSIIPSPLCPFGDGFAFLVTSSADSFTRSKGYIGLPGPQDSFFAVEFDTSFDPSLGDINGNHIGIDVKTAISFASVDTSSRGIDLKSGNQITAWIEYKDALKLIRVWAGYSQIRPPSPLLVVQMDLSEQFKEYMHVGFSAGNGQGSALHIIERWRFKTFASYASVNPIDMVEDGECFMCYPGDSNYDSSSVNVHKREANARDMALELGGLAAFGFSIIAVVGVISFFFIRKKKQNGRGKQTHALNAEPNNVPKQLSLAEIRSATMGFHRNRIVGEGASATVYKGSLSSGGAVAVKRFERANLIDCTRNPFTTEFATMVGCLRHKNLVQLQGWCCEGAELVLVYEYLPNGSLDSILHTNTHSTTLLPWEKRLKIILGVASALSYLHEECERQIIHRDVKSCNIMLDADFNAKLGDFGLAEVYEHSCITREATIPAGTMGYLAPEYVYSGVPSEKTDVYSFGVVVLEVATGRRPVDNEGSLIVDWVWRQWEKGKLLEAADLRLRGKFNSSEMQGMLMVGLACVHPNHEKRPTVKEVARIIRGEAPLPLLPVKKPAVNIGSILSETLMDFGGDQSPSMDDSQWLTPRSRFY